MGCEGLKCSPQEWLLSKYRWGFSGFGQVYREGCVSDPAFKRLTLEYVMSKGNL